MFSILADGLKTEGPKSNMIAEPAQVVVMMPNSRVNKAEAELRDLKTGIAVVALIFIGLFVFAIYWFFSRPKRSLEDMEPVKLKKTSFVEKKAELKDDILLGGPPQMPQKNAGVQNVRQDVRQDGRQDVHQDVRQNVKVHSIPLLPVTQIDSPLDDIVKVTGHIPVWGLEEKDIVETKVSETDATIAAMVREREKLSKALESVKSEVSI